MTTLRFALALLLIFMLMTPGKLLNRATIVTHQAPTGWTIEAVDTMGQVGRGNSLALDADANPHISYYNQDTNTLRYAYRSGNIWYTEVVDDGNGEHSSLALDASGFPHITYVMDGYVRYAFKNATGWHREQVMDARGSLQNSLDLALDGDGTPHIVLTLLRRGSGMTRATVNYAHPGVAAWRLDTLADSICEETCTAVASSALAIDVAGQPHVVYTRLRPLGSNFSDLWYAQRKGDIWVHNVVAPVGFYGAERVALALDSLGSPNVSFSQGPVPDLLYGYCNTTGWQFETVLPGDQWIGRGVDVALDSEDGAHLGFLAYDQGLGNTCLNYARRHNHGWQVETLVDDDVGAISLAPDSHDRPYITYYDQLGGDLRLAVQEPQPPIASFRYVPLIFKR